MSRFFVRDWVNPATVGGQVDSMNTAFSELGFGIVIAVALVYFLMVVNFQSWLDPLIIIMGLPGAFSGIPWMLIATRTTFKVPSLLGTIMCIGVATSNSILLLTFANDQRLEEKANAHDAALAAGATRLRPVLMTALAMILGMIPMSLGLGEGGEQNAPPGRAVIGGLLFATVTTLFFVPVMYSILRDKKPNRNIDTNDSTYQQAAANVKAAEANVENLTATQGFEKIVAPFTGTIVIRSLDTGALIAGDGASGVPVYTETASDLLRVYIDVPQTCVANIHAGQEVQVRASQ